MSRKRKKITGDEALTQAFTAVDHAPLINQLGVTIDDELLCHALTHRSFANEHGNLPNNERLEFLGDAVLGLTVAAKLYDLYPDKAESDISKMRATIVSRYGLADIAREISLGGHILLGKGEIATGGAEKDSILADTMEALFGAILIQHGFAVARDVIARLFAHKIEHATARSFTADWKTALQEHLAQLRYPSAEYVAEFTGPDHEREYTSIVTVAGVELGRGVGPNKKTAEQQAAERATAALSDRNIQAQLAATTL